MNLEPIRRLSNFSNTKLNNLQLSERALVVATMIGISLGCKAILPSSAVNNIEQYSSDAISGFNRIISDINEVFVIDTDTTVSVALAIYKYRYRMVHSAESLVDGFYIDNFTGVVGLPSEIGKILHDKLNQTIFIEIDSIVKDITHNILNVDA